MSAAGGQPLAMGLHLDHKRALGPPKFSDWSGVNLEREMRIDAAIVERTGADISVNTPTGQLGGHETRRLIQFSHISV